MQNSKLKITVLGSGTSQGVPVIACDCKVCASKDSRDKRLRSAIMLSYEGENFVIDSGPDFRQQMLVNEVKTLSAIVYTHEHKDHLAGMDDVRAFNFVSKKPMKLYCSDRVEAALRREFYYVFDRNRYPGVPTVTLKRIEKEKPFKLGKHLIVHPIEAMHFKIPVMGFRIGDFTYLTDAKTVSEEERKKIRGTKILIVNALREEHHVSHFNLEEALAFIEDIQPETAYLTHISHLFDTHEEIEKKLPKHVSVAFDGLNFEIDY